MVDRQDRDEATVAALVDAIYLESCREQARWSGSHGEIVERDGLLLFATGSDFPVGGAGMARLDPEVPGVDAIRIADEWFRDRDRGWSLVTSSSADDADLELAATAAELLRIMDSPTLVCDARLSDAEVPDGIEVRLIDDADGVADMLAINDPAYHSLGLPLGVIPDIVRSAERLLVPNIRLVVAYEDGLPLATALTLLSHGVGGVYYVGTVEAARGRGLAELVTRTVTNLAFDRGAALVTLQASPMGEPIYRRMGYRDQATYTTFTRFV